MRSLISIITYHLSVKIEISATIAYGMSPKIIYIIRRTLRIFKWVLYIIHYIEGLGTVSFSCDLPEIVIDVRRIRNLLKT